MNSLQSVIAAIKSDIELMIKNLSDSPAGMNHKMGKNTLRNSRLIDSSQVKIEEHNGELVINLLFDNYVTYIEQGRKPCTGKQPPIDALRDWALSHNIPADNSTLFAIARAIWRDGIEARPLLATLEEEIERRIEGDWGEMIAEALNEELQRLFAV